MNKIKVRLDNCFGIYHMEHEFDFSNSNVIAVYARNGLMKTSFAKTFKKVQDGKPDEIKDEIFNLSGAPHIECDGSDIDPASIFVIKSFEWIVNSKSDRNYKVRDLLNSAGDR